MEDFPDSISLGYEPQPCTIRLGGNFFVKMSNFFVLSDSERAFASESQRYLDSLEWRPVADQTDQLGVFATIPTGDKGKALLQQMAVDGWSGISLPLELGGKGRTAFEEWLFFEELAYRAIPAGGIGRTAVVPTLASVATEDQKAYWIPRLLSGDFECAVGYTESEAGSDLASLQTRAVRDGHDYVINGTKLFTTAAHYASHIWLATRTDNAGPKHQGITVMIVPVDAEGVNVSPLITVGDGRTNQVTFENVRVPVRNRVGEENDGWSVILEALDHERAFAYSYWARELETFISHLTPDDMRDETIVNAVTSASLRMHVSRLLCMRLARLSSHHGEIRAEAAMVKLWLSESRQRMAAELLEAMGPGSRIKAGLPGSPLEGRFDKSYRLSASHKVGGGSNAIQRDIIGRERLRERATKRSGNDRAAERRVGGGDGTERSMRSSVARILRTWKRPETPFDSEDSAATYFAETEVALRELDIVSLFRSVDDTDAAMATVGVLLELGRCHYSGPLLSELLGLLAVQAAPSEFRERSTDQVVGVGQHIPNLTGIRSSLLKSSSGETGNERPSLWIVDWPSRADLFLLPQWSFPSEASEIDIQKPTGVSCVVKTASFDDVPASIFRISDGNSKPRSMGPFRTSIWAAELGRAALLVGKMRGMVDLTLAYMLERKQFGRALGEFQTVRHAVADMTLFVESAELAIRESFLNFGRTEADVRAWMMTVDWIDEAAHSIAVKCAELHGGGGTVRPHQMQLYYREVMADRLRLTARASRRRMLMSSLLQSKANRLFWPTMDMATSQGNFVHYIPQPMATTD